MSERNNLAKQVTNACQRFFRQDPQILELLGEDCQTMVPADLTDQALHEKGCKESAAAKQDTEQDEGQEVPEEAPK